MAGEDPVNPKLRILFVTGYYKPAYTYGGPARSIPALCEALVRAGCQVTVFTTNANGKERLPVPVSQPLNVSGVEVWYYPLGLLTVSFHSDRQALAVWRRVKEFDLVISEVLWEDLIIPLELTCRRAKVPYLVSPRGQLLPWSLRMGGRKKEIFLWLWGYRYLKNAAAIVCTDRLEAQAVQQILPQARIYVIPNGINLCDFSALPARGALRERLGIPTQVPVLLFLGRLHPKKRPDIAIQVCAALRQQFDVRLLLAGPDETGELASWLDLAAQLGVRDQVHPLGLVNGAEKLQALVDADLMLMPSEAQSENFGMAGLDALAAGLPLLVSDSVPIGHWAAEVGAGRTAPPDLTSFAQAAAEMLQNRDQLKQMGQNGRESIRKIYDIDIVAQQALAHYQEIVSTWNASAGLIDDHS